jgi:MoaA/NifB/PqqE/SkfB family radical SAM enzyme
MKNPKFCLLLLSTKCNLKCKVCRIWSLKERKIPLSKLKIIISKLKAIGINSVAISGGEPLLNLPYLIKILKILKKEKIKNISIVTNSTCLTQKNILSLISNGVSGIYISFDGLEKTHNFLRGANIFSKVIQNIELCVKLRKVYDLPLKIVINTTIHQANLSEIPFLIEKVQELDVDMIGLQSIIIKKGSFGINEKNKKEIKNFWIGEKNAYKLREAINSLKIMKSKNHNFIGNTIEHLDSLYHYFLEPTKLNFNCQSI